MQTVEHHQIGRVAERTGLSLRTIRYYEEAGLVPPSGRTDGGFRLYTEDDIARLELIKALKPVGIPLDELGSLLDLAEELAGDPPHREGTGVAFAASLDTVRRRCDEMERRLAAARRAHRRLADRAGSPGGAAR